jgi:hypothetical protein
MIIDIYLTATPNEGCTDGCEDDAEDKESGEDGLRSQDRLPGLESLLFERRIYTQIRYTAGYPKRPFVTY